MSSHREPESLHPPGWPRPYADYEPHRGRSDSSPDRLPVPWVIEILNGEPVWTTFHIKAGDAHEERLCQICGEALGQIILLGCEDNPIATADKRNTNGPGCHPRCMATAAKFCPHFETGEDAVIAFLYEGEGLGYLFDPDRSQWAAEGPYGEPHEVELQCTEMTRSEVRQLAITDPLGLGQNP